MSEATGDRTLAAGLALLGFGALAACVLYLVAGPILDQDVWWHLAHGRAYLAEGPWLAADPCLGTAARPPIPHSWLFDAGSAAIEAGLGLYGLRVAHALACVALVWLALGLLRREARALAPAALAAGVFLVLVWYRIVQVRPEVLSIVFTLLLHRWLFAPALPSWGAVTAAVGVVALWANVHALFAIGPLLVGAALAGVGARLLAARWGGFDAGDDPRRALRLGVALLGGGLASLLNPRGVGQHLAYLESSGAGAIQAVYDEWAPFQVFAHANAAPPVSLLVWVLTDALLLAFAVTAAVAVVRFLRDASRERLDAADPVRIALGVAGVVALLTAIRFLWLGLFAAVFLVHAAADWRRRSGAQPGARIDAACGVAALAVAALFPVLGSFDDVATHYRKGVSGWLRDAHTGDRFFDAGVRFLRESGLAGQLFHDYALGGYLCHQLPPALRTFIDGSMNVPPDVMGDYQSAVTGRGARPGESLSDTLDRRGVDLYFGFGVPVQDGSPYGTTALAGHPDWRLVSRSWRHGVYLRANPRNAANLAQVAGWYAEQGVPFDPRAGFEPGRVLAERRDWADDWQMWPQGWSALIDAPPAADLARRARDLETLGLGYALVGAWEAGVAHDTGVAALRPRAKAPRRRLVYDLLRLGRVEPALVRSRELVELDPADARSARFAEVARRVDTAPSIDARIRAIDSLPLLSSRQPLRQ
ncbi:MAG: hypothetical protein ACQGVC_19665 [Myxococcota bacterium]